MSEQSSSDQSSCASPLLQEFATPTYQEWRALVDAQLKGAPFEKKLLTKTPEGITLEPLYVRKKDASTDSLPAFPGAFPYTRGYRAEGYALRPWLVCQELGPASAEQASEALRHDIAHGMTALRLRLDSAGLAGLDPDQSAAGIGQGGISITDLRDFCALFQGVKLASLPLVVEAGQGTAACIAMLLAYAQQAEIDPSSLQITFVNDPLALALQQGQLASAPSDLYKQTAALLQVLPALAPKLRILGIDARVYTEAGGSAVQELGFALATAVEYLRALHTLGVAPSTIQPQISFHYSVGSRFFMEIAKLRAARTLWAHALHACGLPPEQASSSLYACTQRWNKTLRDPHVNMLRATAEAMAAVLGGADAITSIPFDAVAGTPDEFSRRIASNMQYILHDEAHLARVADPAGGSHYVETLTQELSTRAWGLFQDIERQGGMQKAIESGFVQAQLAATQQSRLSEIAQRKEVIVGTTMYADVNEKLPAVPASAAPEFAAKRVEHARTARNAAKAVGPSSLDLARAMQAAKAGATLGSLSLGLTSATPHAYKLTALNTRRASTEYEQLRQRAEAFRDAHGRLPSVFLATMGPLAQHKARAEFARDFFEPGGFKILSDKGFELAEDAASAARASGAELVVLCSTDETYGDLVPAFCAAFGARGARPPIILAGYPQELIESFKAAGIDEFIHLRANNLQLLTQFHHQIGAL